MGIIWSKWTSVIHDFDLSCDVRVEKGASNGNILINISPYILPWKYGEITFAPPRFDITYTRESKSKSS